MEPIRFEVKWTKKDAVNYALEGKIKTWRFILWAVICLVLGNAALVIQFTMISDVYILVIGLAGIITPIAFIIMTVNRAHSGYDSRPQLQLPVWYEMIPGEIKRESQSGTIILTHSEVHAVANLKGYIAIAISPQSAYVIPKRCIPAGQAEKVMEILDKFERQD
jgi:hypothetical protein